MKKKIIACTLVFVMVISSFGFAVGHAEQLRGMDYIAKRLTIFTHEDRTNLETIFIPMLITDTGLDALINTVSEYTPESEALMHTLLTKLLVRVEKDEVIKVLSYLYLIDEKVREEYIGGYYYREEKALSDAANKEVAALMDGVFSKYPDLRAVFEEDGITAGVVARVLEMFHAVNKNTPIFKKTQSGIEINYIDADLKSKLDLCIAKYDFPFKTTGELLDAVLGHINENYAGIYSNFITAASEIGLLAVERQPGEAAGAPGGAKSEVGSVNIRFNESDMTVTVSGADKDGKILSVGEYKLFAVEFNCSKKGYLIDPDGEVVKLCVYDNGVWYAFLTKIGTYTIAEASDGYFKDVSGWGKDYINALYERKIVNGRTKDTFCPDDNITREEFVKLIVEMFGLKGDYGQYFTDVDKNAWYYEYVSAAKFYGIVDGFEDGSFGVGKLITRQDMCKILYSVAQSVGIKFAGSGIALEFADRSLIADYAYPSVMALKRANIVSGDEFGRFNPTNCATRQEAAKLIYNILVCYVKY